ncbi:MAG: HEAT repeat domain-containing protein, partial [Thermodesulfobacteriota bacterium]
RLDRDVFINVRDYLLMTHPAGQAVNAFYYRYTLYPAELFKSPAQKLLTPVRLTGVNDADTRRQIARQLADSDYLPVADTEDAWRVHVDKTDGTLLFADARGPVLNSNLDQFLNRPEKVLQRFSRQSDTAGVFRQFTFFSLLGALPLSLYVFAHGLFGGLLVFICRVPVQSLLASLVCLAIGLGAVWPLYGIAPAELSKSEIGQYLEADDWTRQRDALKAISEQGIDPMRFPIDAALADSEHVPVRYWLARALSNSHQPAAYRMLLTFLDDLQPNVGCMAYYGLGQSNRKEAVTAIKKRLPTIRHWYKQWYAYKALRRLGWTQPLSDTISGPPA